MAVLTEQSTLGVLLPALLLVMQILFDEEVKLGVQLRLLVSVLGEWSSVRKFHDPLVANADALATVVARDTRFCGDAVARPTGSLDGVDQHVACPIRGSGRVVTLVESLVAVGNVARGAAHAGPVAAACSPLDADMTTLALLALIGEGRQLGVGLNFFG